jgi:hypothetical protein
LDLEATQIEFRKITKEINLYLESNGNKKMSEEEVAIGFLNIANVFSFLFLIYRRPCVDPLELLLFQKDMTQVIIYYLYLVVLVLNMRFF